MKGDDEEEGAGKQIIEVPLSVIQRFFSKRENLTAFMTKKN